MKNDYRNTKYEVSNKNIVNEKIKLDKKIKREHPKVKVVYNQLNKRDGEYNKQFRAIYGNKCAYCGITTNVISKELFEIDHFICESSFNGDTINAGKINNLVLSCKKCNRAKKDFVWSSEYSTMFNVDDESITKLFYRDNDYSIKIEQEYLIDVSIRCFYDKLKFNEEIRRLDFLLMNMYGFLEKNNCNEDLKKLSNHIIYLQKIRNNL